MPLCTIHLLHFTPTTSLQHFLTTLSSVQPPLAPLTIARPLRWIITPTVLSSSLPSTPWDILLILPSTSPLPPVLQELVKQQWSVVAGVPSALIKNYEEKNRKLLHPGKGEVPVLKERGKKIAKSSQDLELSPELAGWIEKTTSNGTSESTGAVSMLNLLAFKPGLKEEYLKYGKAFSESVGSSRGGIAKIVGSVIPPDGKGDLGGGGKDWDEIALAHYPSLWHFADMLASEDYQAANHRWRVGSLRDTFILCTSEVGWEEMMKGEKARL